MVIATTLCQKERLLLLLLLLLLWVCLPLRDNVLPATAAATPIALLDRLTIILVLSRSENLSPTLWIEGLHWEVTQYQVDTKSQLSNKNHNTRKRGKNQWRRK
jgi:hypothetical protein